MDPSLLGLIDRLNRISSEFQELREGVRKAILVADVDPEMALTRARKVLEYVVRDVFERRIQEPPGTRPLENLLQRLVKDGHFPERLDAYANTVRKLGNVGTHNFGGEITTADVYQSLTQLMPILEWYFESERPEAGVGPGLPPRHEVNKPNPPEPAGGDKPQTHGGVVPKGLRSFDAADSDFFLQLLPGARDKDGLPESLRFWKHRIEATDEPTFTVGVIYGPSGCGKSSLMKAGLLPRLSRDISSIYVEAAPDDTEARLLRGLRRRLPTLSGDLDLPRTIAALRRGEGLPADRKVLLVLDQFEQWLHARRQEQDTELAQALRQCDGEHVRCVVLVRDDFWMALTRFMADLHVELLQGQNIAPVDLFDARHARKVLTEFGRAFGCLPDDLGSLSRDQGDFLDQAVEGLAQDGRVISIRLALFAEMAKGKPWTPATLKAVGGTAGVGVTFLDEAFSSTALRRHQKAAQAILKALLPEGGANLKGHMRSHEELLGASGYSARPQEFGDLLRILDGEVRLITPTEPAGTDGEDRESPATAGGRYYQLTHDYLVPSLRKWLTHKQKETRRGRAELRLAERAALWDAKPENRFLPSAWDWCRIRLLTRVRDWSEPQRRMMKRAGRVHGLRSLGLVALIALGTWLGIEGYGKMRAAALVESLQTASTSDVPLIIEQLPSYRRWANPRLVRILKESEPTSRDYLHASLALIPVDPRQVDYLSDRILSASPTELPVIWAILKDHRPAPVERLRDVLDDPQADPDRRFRAACALANADAAGTEQRWDDVAPFVADHLLASVTENPSHYTPLIEVLRTVRDRLLRPLSSTFRDENRTESERSLTASILADYARDQQDVLADLLLDSGERTFEVLFAKLKVHQERAVTLLEAELAKKPVPEATADAKDRRNRRQGRAAVALVRLGHPEKVWGLLRHSPDPSVRSYIVNWLKPLGAEPTAMASKLIGMGATEEKAPVGDRSEMDAILFHPETSVRRALILALGQHEADTLSPGEREPLVAKLMEAYRDDPDAGIHGAAEWTLRRWKQEEKMQRIDAEFKGRDRGERRWYVNSEGQTLAVIEGPVEFTMGSPTTELGRRTVETPHHKRINRRFAIATKEVTVAQYQRFLEENSKIARLEIDRGSPEPSGPMIGMTWYEAAAYCNWLSRQEDLEECYEPNTEGEYDEGMKVVADFLDRPGYRLPTESEWEYACRGGAVTSRYHGGSAELLGKYAWYVQNSKEHAWPVGRLQPNDLGLFDMLGSVFEWCQDRYGAYAPGEDKSIDLNIKKLSLVIGADPRLLRGGAFKDRAAVVRSAYRGWNVPSDRAASSGFRPARTCP